MVRARYSSKVAGAVSVVRRQVQPVPVAARHRAGDPDRRDPPLSCRPPAGTAGPGPGSSRSADRRCPSPGPRVGLGQVDQAAERRRRCRSAGSCSPDGNVITGNRPALRRMVSTRSWNWVTRCTVHGSPLRSTMSSMPCLVAVVSSTGSCRPRRSRRRSGAANRRAAPCRSAGGCRARRLRVPIVGRAVHDRVDVGHGVGHLAPGQQVRGHPLHTGRITGVPLPTTENPWPQIPCRAARRTRARPNVPVPPVTRIGLSMTATLSRRGLPRTPPDRA